MRKIEALWQLMTSLKYSKIVSKSEKPGATTELCGHLLSCDLLGSPGAVPQAGGEGGLTVPYHWAGLLLRAQSFLRGGVGFLFRFGVLDRCPSHLFRTFIACVSWWRCCQEAVAGPAVALERGRGGEGAVSAWGPEAGATCSPHMVALT